MSTESKSSESTAATTETVEQPNNTTETVDRNQDSANTGAGETPPEVETPTDKTDGEKQDPPQDPKKLSLLADLHRERKDRQSAQSRVAELESQVTELQTKAETVDAIQTKYDRLEAFVQAAGGNLGRVLDSRSFTKALFETDDPIEDIVKEWNKANPSTTSQALSGGTIDTAKSGPTMNDLLRTAISGSK